MGYNIAGPSLSQQERRSFKPEDAGWNPVGPTALVAQSGCGGRLLTSSNEGSNPFKGFSPVASRCFSDQEKTSSRQKELIPLTRRSHQPTKLAGEGGLGTFGLMAKSGLRHPTHNRLIAGSNPAGPTRLVMRWKNV